MNYVWAAIIVAVMVALGYYGRVWEPILGDDRKVTSPKVHEYTAPWKTSSIWSWFMFSWQFPVGWVGPYYKVYEYGRRICGFETRYMVTWLQEDDDPKNELFGLIPPKKS